ncbi:MAG TPA: FAD-binding oxidoreductase [Cryptosporangiaceae bacterium]|nr:FAD-binding oxidoreductase [Cryptosporangiaceae bacterium]
MSDHGSTVASIRDAYARLPADQPVRLRKSTSNLFRFRSSAGGERLDVRGLDRVLSVDPHARTADVQGMVTYERLVDATLAHGLMPLVVPQLKTITLGGAVAGLGIESSSFRHGLPHESVLEMEVLTGDGRVVTARPEGEHADLYRGFPNSYGSLGYALRLKIELQPVRPVVRLRHLRFSDAAGCAEALSEICTDATADATTDATADRTAGATTPDFVDGTVFGPDELYLTLGEFVDAGPATSDYTGQRIYYRSIREREVDHLSVRDYLWRWDTDWFWCSRAFGAQHPLVRRLWPRRWLRSDVYRRLVALDRRLRFSDRLGAARGRPPEEPVIQDVEIPVERLAEFLDVFHRDVGIEPVWLCPLRLRDAHKWPLYPLEPDRLYVNVGFWSTVPLAPGQPPDTHNRLIERLVGELGGHKSLYSTVHYTEEEFWERYDGVTYGELKHRYDAGRRLPDLYEKCVRDR